MGNIVDSGEFSEQKLKSTIEQDNQVLQSNEKEFCSSEWLMNAYHLALQRGLLERFIFCPFAFRSPSCFLVLNDSDLALFLFSFISFDFFFALLLFPSVRIYPHFINTRNGPVN